MDTLRIAGKILASPLGSPLLALTNRLLYIGALRRALLRCADAWLLDDAARSIGTPPTACQISRERRLLGSAVLHTVDHLVARGNLSPSVTRIAAELWTREALLPAAKQPVGQRFKEQFGCEPPWFVVLSPGQACNLHCNGCYADSGTKGSQLPWDVSERIVDEARSLWGVPLVVISGGEPLVYRSQGKDILDLMERHRDCMYLMFTNGTLIDAAMAERMAELGGLTPAISVEGLRERTEQRRGQGVFERILSAMAHLRRVGVPFGISVTVTSQNCDEVMSDEFLDFFFTQQGAFYGFIFHYMPIGRGSALEWMPTPQQRMALWQRSWDVIVNKKVFLFDFWNSGPVVQGCISAGREGGYLHIDWHGQVTPCVFAPYSVANIQEVYAQGHTLNDIWQAPFFQAIRQWQREYGYGQEPCVQGNWLRPCPIRDHHALFRHWVEEYAPQPQNDAAREAMQDPEYARSMVAYGQGVQECSQPIWQKHYLARDG